MVEKHKGKRKSFVSGQHSSRRCRKSPFHSQGNGGHPAPLNSQPEGIMLLSACPGSATGCFPGAESPHLPKAHSEAVGAIPWGPGEDGHTPGGSRTFPVKAPVQFRRKLGARGSHLKILVKGSSLRFGPRCCSSEQGTLGVTRGRFSVEAKLGKQKPKWANEFK